MNEKPTFGLAVDGFCSGNPGPGGYRGIDLETGEELFNLRLDFCSNNIAEFVGLVHAIGLSKKNGKEGKKYYPVIYSDSVTAIAWVKKKQSNSDIKLGIETQKMVEKCEGWLLETKSIPLVKKWITAEWGEIPADFGNKK